MKVYHDFGGMSNLERFGQTKKGISSKNVISSEACNLVGKYPVTLIPPKE